MMVLMSNPNATAPIATDGAGCDSKLPPIFGTAGNPINSAPYQNKQKQTMIPMLRRNRDIQSRVLGISRLRISVAEVAIAMMEER
jgi:hypothetical protein